LTGFKSFVDQTELIIQDGLTGIVGPNGCGKSNLLEAIRWVMGENRPTAMRGGGMEDVIFAGAATRTAKNFAEVSLILDNSQRLAPQAFNDNDLIEIVRRITRDVGSAFKASGKDIRARDVQMLFADASTGAHSPALVRQGQIAELMNADVEVMTDDQRFRPEKSEVNRLFGSNELLRDLTDWNPQYGGVAGFKRGLAKTIEWFTNSSNLSHYKHDQYNV